MKKPAMQIRTAVLSLTLSGLLTIGAAGTSLGAGTVTADALRLRSAPTTGSDILATASSGSSVVVLEDSGNGWYKVDYNTIEGYMHGDFLKVMAAADLSLGYAYITTGSSSLNMRSGPSTGYGIVASIPGSAVVPISGIDGGWYKVAYSGCTGYISSEYTKLVRDTSGARSDGDGVAVLSAAVADTSLGSEIVAYAKQFLGRPYVYGANGPNSFDCSGFTKYIYAHFGYSIYRTASSQLSNGVSVSRTRMEPGDLVFFRNNTSKAASHVGIYVGNGQFIHASSTGDVVKISDLSSGYYCNILVGVRRII